MELQRVNNSRYSGDSHSLTYHLYKKGYRGITIDSLIENGVLNKILRPKDTFMLKLVGRCLKRYPSII